jgi:hypothetical protein
MRKEVKTEKFVSDSGSRTPIPECQEKCSTSAGTGVRLESESVFGFVRNMHLDAVWYKILNFDPFGFADVESILRTVFQLYIRVNRHLAGKA